VHSYLYLNDNPAYDWTLCQKAIRSTQLIKFYLESHLKRLSNGIVIILHFVISSAAHFVNQLSINGICDLLFSNHLSSHKGEVFLSEVLKVTQQASIEEIASCLFEEIIPSAALFSVVIASVVKYYMCTQDDDFFSDCQDEGSEQRPAILQYICKALSKSSAFVATWTVYI
jgi:linoleate 10R-lipoxygenase